MLSFFKRFRYSSDLTIKQLSQINHKLLDLNLPIYWQGGYRFNPLYRLDTTPRFLVTWRGLKLSQVYLRVIVEPHQNNYEQVCKAFSIVENQGSNQAYLSPCYDTINKVVTLEF